MRLWWLLECVQLIRDRQSRLSHLAQCQEECFQQRAILPWKAHTVRMLSFHHTLTAAHFMDYCPPPTAEIVQTLSYVTASRRWALQSASSIKYNSFLEINKKNCSMLMWHLRFMTEVQTVDRQGSIGYGWCDSLILPCCIEQRLQLSENFCVQMCCV